MVYEYVCVCEFVLKHVLTFLRHQKQEKHKQGRLHIKEGAEY